jgi:signal transduction histidine kinase
MTVRRQPRDCPYPSAVWWVVLGTVFLTEHAVMGVLPWLLPGPHGRFLEATVDSLVLTAVLAPLAWWAAVRPLRELIRLRSRFLTDLFARIEADRRHTAHDLHDGVGQSLSLLVSGLKTAHAATADPAVAVRCEHLLGLARAALEDVRRLSLGLRPSVLDDLGLAPALERLVADVREHHPIDVTLDVTALTGGRLPEGVETAVFRIVQEAVANVVKHSGAKAASVAIRRRDGVVTAEVADDGRGFRPAEKGAAAGHLGLTGMRERAILLGGRFTIDAAPCGGTRIRAEIPVEG